MRKKIVAGNWKMNGDLPVTFNLINGIKDQLSVLDTDVEVVICPPFVVLESAKELIKDTEIKLGAQNVSQEDWGAFTGEISIPMIKSVGCEYVIVGHSERRTFFNETDELINKKVKAAANSMMKTILCIGETLEQRGSEITKRVIETQVKKGLEGVKPEFIENIVIAYEPVWAIGTGKTATPEMAQEVHGYIRELLKELYSAETADNLTIQYGGSVKPDNAAELFAQPDIDGGLIGGASLKADSFVEIIKAAS